MDQSGFMPPPAGFPGQQVLNDPMANMAVQYGQSLAGQGKEYMKENVSEPQGCGVDDKFFLKRVSFVNIYPLDVHKWGVVVDFL